MTWKPTTRDLETIAVLGHARAPVAKIAAAVGITREEFAAWTGRLVAARQAGMPVVPPRPATRTLDLATVERPTLRIVAERLFERGSA